MDKILGILAVLVLALVSVGGAEAVITWDQVDGRGVTGATQNLSIIMTDNTVNNVTVAYQLSTGGYVFIAEAVNDSVNQTGFDVTWDTTTLADQGGITLIAIGYTTLTTEAEAANITNMNIDNTNPTGSYGEIPTNITENETIDFVTASDTSLVNCTLSFNSPINGTGSNFTATAAGNLCTMRFTAVPEGTYTYRWFTRDNLNETALALTTFSLDSGVGAVNQVVMTAGAAAIAQKVTGTQIAVVVVVLIGGYFLFFKE